jgi:hypothetical protein
VRVVVVPPVPALLPEYAGLVDPVADLRAAAESAVAWLVEGAGGVRIEAADGQAERVARHLLGASAPHRLPTRAGADDPVLVMANGSAKRSEKAPGHLDERALAFDRAMGTALAAGDVSALAATDPALAAELWATGPEAFAALSGLVVEESRVDYDDDPYGVAYWVVRWTCGS